MHPTALPHLTRALAALLLLGACGDDGAVTAASGAGGDGGTTPGGDGGGVTSGEPSSSTGLGSSTVVTVGDASTGVGGSTSDGGASGSGGDPGAGGRGEGGAIGNGGSGSGGEPGSGGATGSGGDSGTGGSGQGGDDTTTGSGGGCSVDGFFSDPTCDACAIDACCAEVEDCVGDVGECLDANDVIDPDTTYGGPLLDCLGASCANACGVGSDDEICDSNVGYLDENGQPDLEMNACVEMTCCEPYRDCTADGANAAACVDCLEAEGGPLCNAAIDCLAESGCLGGICGSGLDSDPPDPAFEACIEGSCCVPFDACYGSATSAEVAACNACLQAGQGALCDALIACIIDNDC